MRGRGREGGRERGGWREGGRDREREGKGRGRREGGREGGIKIDSACVFGGCIVARVRVCMCACAYVRSASFLCHYCAYALST